MKSWNVFVAALVAGPWSAIGQGAPEIVRVMALENLSVREKPRVEKTYKYLREPNAVVTKNGTLMVVAGPHHVRGKSDRAHQDALCRTSEDGGKTWPVGACVAPGWAFGYNVLVELPDGKIGLVFEGSPASADWSQVKRDPNTGARLGIYLATFSLDGLPMHQSDENGE